MVDLLSLLSCIFVLLVTGLRCGCQLLIESYASSGPYSIRTAVKAAFIQLLSVFVNKLGDVAGRLVSGLSRSFSYCCGCLTW